MEYTRTKKKVYEWVKAGKRATVNHESEKIMPRRKRIRKKCKRGSRDSGLKETLLSLLKTTKGGRLKVSWPASNASDGFVFLGTVNDGEDIMGKILTSQDLDLVGLGKCLRAHPVLLREIAILQGDRTDNGPIQELRVALDDILLQHLVLEDACHKHTREELACIDEVVAKSQAAIRCHHNQSSHA